MKTHHPVQRKNAEIVSCYAKPSNKKSGTRIFPKTTNQKEMRDWHHIKVVWSINLERRASEYKDSESKSRVVSWASRVHSSQRASKVIQHL
jgi:hypothetical protein